MGLGWVSRPRIIERKPRGDAPYRLRHAGKDDTDALTSVVAKAFQDDPVAIWLLPDPEIRKKVKYGYVRMLAEYALDAGTVDLITARDTEKLVAAALWWDADLAFSDYDERLREVVPADVRPRFLELNEIAQSHESELPSGLPRVYLAFLAVLPKLQRNNLGTTLLNHRHGILDAARKQAFLHASSTASRRLYLRHRYADRPGSFTLPNGPKMFPMLRLPVAG